MFYNMNVPTISMSILLYLENVLNRKVHFERRNLISSIIEWNIYCKGMFLLILLINAHLLIYQLLAKCTD